MAAALFLFLGGAVTCPAVEVARMSDFAGTCLRRTRAWEHLPIAISELGGTVSGGLFQRSGELEPAAMTTETSGRDWAAIGVDLAAAFALIAIFCVGMWAVVILVEASA